MSKAELVEQAGKLAVGRSGGDSFGWCYWRRRRRSWNGCWSRRRGRSSGRWRRGLNRSRVRVMRDGSTASSLRLDDDRGRLLPIGQLIDAFAL